ncbi:hypothetical protein Sjap_020332 [Stephania japonica]|uniref:F-box domain-containing protein n=1 Tax=Stephania japonica TaxID=461633 RepID=A0AAP0HVH5_9MAGN
MDQYGELPDDMLHLIVRKLSSLVCYAAFRSVCRRWRSFSLQHYKYLVLPQPPWLMFPNSTKPPSRVYDLYTFDGTRQFFQFETPENCERRWSSGSWLIFTDKKEKKIRVWNPLSSIHILLPNIADQLKSGESALPNKIIVSCSGPLIKNRNDVIFGVVYNDKKLAFMRLRDKAWTIVEVDLLHTLPRPSSKELEIIFKDIAFYHGKLYAVNQLGKVYVCEEAVHAPSSNDYHRVHHAKAELLIDNSYNMQGLDPKTMDIKHYLVEVDGELMHIISITGCSTSAVVPETSGVVYLRVDEDSGNIPSLETNILLNFGGRTDACKHRKDSHAVKAILRQMAAPPNRDTQATLQDSPLEYPISGIRAFLKMKAQLDRMEIRTNRIEELVNMISTIEVSIEELKYEVRMEIRTNRIEELVNMISTIEVSIEELKYEDEKEDEDEDKIKLEKGKWKVEGKFEIGGTSGTLKIVGATNQSSMGTFEGIEDHHTSNESMHRDIRDMHELLKQVLEKQETSRGAGKGSTHTLQLQELISSPIHDQNNQHYLKMIYELLTELLKSSLQHRDSVTQIQKQQDLQQERLTEIQKQHDLIQKQQDLIQKQQELNQKQQELNQAYETQILKHQESQLKLLNEKNKLHDYIQRQQELQQELIGCKLPHRIGKLGPLDSGTQVWDHWDRMEDDLMNILTEIRKIWKSFLAQQNHVGSDGILGLLFDYVAAIGNPPSGPPIVVF